METTSEMRERIRKTVCTPFLALTVDEVAALANISTSNLYAIKAEGKGPVFRKIGARSVILLGDYETWALNLPIAPDLP